jgi:ribosome recycling factor
MPTNPFINTAISEFDKAIAHLNEEFARLQVGRANPALIEGIMVEAYGSSQPLKNMANISVPEPKTLQVQPWDKSVMGTVEKAILQADIGLNPVNTGAALMITIPALTEERRKELVKIVNKLSEEARISIRTARQTAHSKFKSMVQEKTITQDDAAGGEKKLQEKVDSYNGKVAELAKAKEESVMTV